MALIVSTPVSVKYEQLRSKRQALGQKRSNAPWSPEEDARVWEGHLGGVSLQKAAKNHSRSPNAIRARIKLLTKNQTQPDRTKETQ